MPDSTTGVSLDGSVVGHLPESVSAQVASALDRGQTFTAKIINAYQDYDANLKATTVSLDLKVEYPLEEGQPAIDAPTRPFVVDGPTSAVSPSFFTKIAGVTHERRQSIVARCSEGERLLLLREPGNPVDPGAIKVLRQNGQHLGYIPAHVSRHGDPSGLAFRMDQGIQCGCRIKNITGGGPGESLGGNIEIMEGGDFANQPQFKMGPSIHEAPVLPADRSGVKSALLWTLALIVIGCILWAALK